MRLYEVRLSFEFAEGGSTMVFPNLAAARSRAVELLKEHMQDMVDTADRLDMPEIDRGIPDLSAKIDLVETPPVTKEVLCDIINSNGGSYVRSNRTVMTIALPAGAKRPVVKRVEKGEAHEGRADE